MTPPEAPCHVHQVRLESNAGRRCGFLHFFSNTRGADDKIVGRWSRRCVAQGMMGNTKLGHSCALIVCRCHSRMPPPFIHPMTTRPLKHQCCSSHPSVVNCEWRCFISCFDEDFAYWRGKESEANRAFHLENRLTPDTLYSSYIAFKDIAFGTSFVLALFLKKQLR